MIISAHNLKLKYGLKVILDDVSFSFTEKDKIGVIGGNGEGKSSFLKILASLEQSDAGYITKPQDIKISYLEQMPKLNESISIINYIKKECAKNKQLNDFEIIGLLNKFGLKNHEKLINTLSGGQQKRLAMAICLSGKNDCLLLDEPTNHLDSKIILWLEKYLLRFTGAIIMVTHDRYFLERITNRMYELENGKIIYYEGNYQSFIEKKALHLEVEKNKLHKLKQLYKQELEWMRKGVEARRTKKKDRIEKFNELAKINFNKQDQDLEFIEVESYLGKKTIEFERISYGYDDKVLVNDFSYILSRHDRICITGDNGCGKTTFFNLILQKMKPLNGDIIFGPTVKIGHFQQVLPECDVEMKVIDYIKEVGYMLQTSDGQISASELCERFLFDANAQFGKINMLSGGERKRLELLRILMQAPNVLLLDEPTNDLDIYTLEILENYLETFGGAVLIISHDRYFIDKVCNKILYFKDKKITETLKSIEEVLEIINEKEVEVEKQNKVIKNKKVKLSYFEQIEWNKIESDLEVISSKITELDQLIVKFSSDYIKVIELNDEKMKLDSELLRKLERYEYLENIINNKEEQ